MHKAVHPPRRPERPERAKSERTLRIVPPSPALSTANLSAFNKSTESLSSIYSRSTSGERYSARLPTNEGRSFSSSSTATVKKSGLGAMRLASNPEVIVVAETRSRSMSETQTSDIDDVATLQAKLPSVKAVSEFGEVEAWTSRPHCTAGHRSNPFELLSDEDEKKQRHSYRPLTIRKTTKRVSIIQSRCIVTIA